MTASARGAPIDPPSSTGLPNRCQPVADQYRTGTSSAIPLAFRGMRSVGPVGADRLVSRTQQRSRFSTAAASAAVWGSDASTGSSKRPDPGRPSGVRSAVIWRGTVSGPAEIEPVDTGPTVRESARNGWAGNGWAGSGPAVRLLGTAESPVSGASGSGVGFTGCFLARPGRNGGGGFSAGDRSHDGRGWRVRRRTGRRRAGPVPPLPVRR